MLLQIRLPRVVSAASVGIILSLSGLALQALFKNDLAEPGILGISSGGTLGAVICIFVFSTYQAYVPYYITPLFAIVFSFLSIYLIVRWSRDRTSNVMILLGVAINSFNAAMITLISYISDNSSLRNIIFWGMGSFTNTNIPTSALLSMLAAALWIIYHKKHKLFNALRLSNENLYYTGHNLRGIQLLIIITVTIAVGSAVAFCGIIAFVGLVAPHIARILVGHNHKHTVITTPLISVVLVLFTDLVCKNLLYPIELPTSVVTSFIGAPYFIHLIHSSKKSQGDH
ncbi:MAG TPA: iron ABC transporter permease [Cytophagales bacterium]|nr:iron ABC transporter permease [Cytophagales bacterium]